MFRRTTSPGLRLLGNLQRNPAVRVIPRTMSTQEVNKMPRPEQDPAYEDFRPPWVYTGSRLLTYVFVPYVVFYSVFFYDFGDREHVFQPVRRWASRQRESFFSLSPEEARIVQAEKAKGVIEPPPSGQQ
ncbi:hypothetical protein PLEOSDRAFT_1099698 [Pleurotus ostreatus PC15]|uniref:Uncharacterized protein n=1 Tax=Pleurotus ostreatus (strain PC15) TaxID=1137138 RepID=A0A067P094_PLEO1|nr:hypothetical protein PLEOSDRAFT_1099698 [Pleurotus ostreatus PC15]